MVFLCFVSFFFSIGFIYGFLCFFCSSVLGFIYGFLSRGCLHCCLLCLSGFKKVVFLIFPRVVLKGCLTGRILSDRSGIFLGDATATRLRCLL